jgi:mono/diheme cytochrome c family protein
MKITLIALCLAATSIAHADEAQVAKGHQVYDHWCMPCHGADSGFFGPDSQLPGTAALEALYNGARPAVLTDRTDLTTEYVETIVRTGVSIMPFFRKTEISDEDLAAISAYLTEK